MKRKFPKCFLLILLFTEVVMLHAQRSEQIGGYKEYQQHDHGVNIVAENATMDLTVYAPDIIRVRVVKHEFGRDFSYAVIQQPRGKFSDIRDETTQLVLSTGVLQVVVSKNPVRIHFYNKEGNLLNEDYSKLGISWQGTEVTCFKKLFPDERFIGLGEKTGPLNRRGSSYVNWNTDHYAYGAGDDPLYTTTPFFIGLHDTLAYGIFFDNTFRTAFDFGASTDNQYSSFSADAGEMNYYFFGASAVAKIIESYTFLTGTMKMPPLWSLGYQQCRWSYYPDAEVLNLARTFREKSIPADVIYLDIHYMDAYKIFTWNPERFPHPKVMIDSLKMLGFHIVTIVDPGIKIEKGYFAYDEGVKNNYFIKYPGGEYYTGSVWPGRCHFPDFTKAAVREWWGKSFAHLIGPGVEGFWNDMNEPATWGQHVPGVVELDLDNQTSTMMEAHNIYGMQMARSTYEGTKTLLGGNRPFVLSRAGYSGIQRYSAVWTGDNVPSDEHMLLAVRLVNSMGVSGIAFAGSDIGGFSGDATPELFTRWLSIGTFTPFFRNHKQFGMKQQEPWSFGEEVEELSRNSIALRYQLLPYIYSTFFQTTQTGLPVARTLAIDYSFDEHVYYDEFQNEYLFGDNLLIAPVASTEKYCRVYLPEGEWYRWKGDEHYAGYQSAVVGSSLNDLPVFVRAGGIIPMQSVVQSTSQQPSDTLQLHVFFGKKKTSFGYYEDDGITYGYENGMCYRRTISFNPGEREIVLVKVDGKYRTKFKNINLKLHGFGKITKLSVNQKIMNLRVNQDNDNLKELVFDNADNAITIRW